jgi:shikimate dehydrogenase
VCGTQPVRQVPSIAPFAKNYDSLRIDGREQRLAKHSQTAQEPEMSAPDQVNYVSGKSRLFAILGHPIAQVRSPEMVTAEIVSRGFNGILVPMHVLPDDFEAVMLALMKLPNLDGLIFTIPFKARAIQFAQTIGPNATTVGAINALGRDGSTGWRGEIFDGLGCVEAFRRRGVSFRGQRVMLIGAGGAGSAIGVAVAHEQPAAMRLFDPDEARVRALAAKIAGVSPQTVIEIGQPSIADRDILMNASPVGMLDNARLPFDGALVPAKLPRQLIVFDAIVMPETTPLLALAEASGCTIIRGREMMRGQIARIVDYFGVPPAAA